MNRRPDIAACRGCLCLAARRRAREITRIYDAHLRPHGLRATQFSLLAALALGDGTPVVRLADALGLERTTLTRGAAILERHGWIASEAAGDARLRPMRLTATGRQKLESAYPAWQAAQNLVSKARPA